MKTTEKMEGLGANPIWRICYSGCFFNGRKIKLYRKRSQLEQYILIDFFAIASILETWFFSAFAASRKVNCTTSKNMVLY